MKTAKIFFAKDDDILDIRYDNVFKAVFTRESRESRTALSRLVSAMIGKQVKVLRILANEPPVDNVKDRQVRFDINCKTDKGELINVEMFYNPEPFEPVRLEFYTGKLFTGQDIKGVKKNYNDLKQAYQIAILSKERFFPDNSFYHSFEYYDPANNVSLNGKSRIITLELAKVGRIVDKPIGKMTAQEFWAVFFQYLTDAGKRGKINEILKREEGIAMASRVVMKISKDEEERARIMRDEKIELDWQSIMVTAERRGEQRGERRGEQRGERRGVRKGKREGERNGIKIGNQQIIDLLKSGKSPDDIIRQFG